MTLALWKTLVKCVDVQKDPCQHCCSSEELMEMCVCVCVCERVSGMDMCIRVFTSLCVSVCVSVRGCVAL